MKQTATHTSRTGITMNTLRALTGLFVLAAIAGCATPPAPPPAPKAGTSEVRLALEESLSRINRMPAHSSNADSKAPEAALSGNNITIHDYQNDASKLLSRIAKARGMKFTINGPEPRLPLFIQIDVTNVTLEELLTNIHHQFGQRASVVLSDGAIEIRYRGM